MLNSKPTTTLGCNGQTLSKHDGALQYLILATPYISSVVNKVCQFMAAPTTSNWLVVKRILRYLNDTSSYGICIQQSP